MLHPKYIDTAEEVTQRILDFIPTNPQILKIDDAWDLFGIEGLSFKDLEPSLFQASFALSKAKALYKEATT